MRHSTVKNGCLSDCTIREERDNRAERDPSKRQPNLATEERMDNYHYPLKIRKSFSSTHFDLKLISVLCLFGVYAISVDGTLQTENDSHSSIDRNPRSLVHSQMLNYALQEESQRGTFVGNVGRDIVDLISTGSTQHSDDQTRSSQVDLTITNWRDRAVQLFSLDPASGQLRVASPPDREAICPATGGTNSNFEPHYLQPTHDTEKSLYSNDKYAMIRGHATANNPCYVDLKIAFTLRQPISSASNPVDVATHAPKDPGLITVRVQIQDINDHTPAFPQSRVSSELGELSALPEKTTIDLPTAFDPDAGENGTISYWVMARTPSTNSLGRTYEPVPPNKPASGTAGSDIPFRLAGDPLRLILTQQLDWESKREYDLIVYAKDYGKPQSLTGQLSVHVTVRDENDNIPQFSQNTYTAVINESVLRGTIIMELTASDADSSSNGQLTFSLAPPTNSQERLAMQYFGIRTISPNQAAIYVIQTPDVDAAPRTTFSDRSLASQSELGSLNEKVGKKFTFHAIVRDNGYPRQLSSRTVVTVLVLDVNDMAPNIFVSYLTPSQPGEREVNRVDFGRYPSSGERSHGQVKENSERAFIAFVTVQDFDSGVWGQVRCFTNNDAFELLPVNDASASSADSFTQYASSHQTVVASTDVGAGETGFKLLAIKPFDREQVSELSFHIICVDNPQYVGSTSANYVSQINPYFSSQVNYGSASPGSGAAQLTGTALVRVLVTDENDNSPHFSRTQYSFSMDEADGSLTRGGMIASDSQLFVGRVSAADQDSTSQIVYSLPADLLSQFRIEPETGKIFAVHQFDREEILRKVKQNEYLQTTNLRAEVEADKLVYLQFSVTATDGVHNSTAKVRVLIRDVNDNPPVFTKSQYEFVVSENEQPIQSGSIGTLEAHDLDADMNAQIIYQLFDVADSDPTEKSVRNQSSRPNRFTVNMLFTISAKSGQLHLIRKLDREKQSHHIFYVLAIDNPREGHVNRSWQTGASSDLTTVSTRSHTSTATVTVIVADVNDNAPVITYPTPHGVINVESGAPAGHNLFTVVAHDPDAGENGTVRFTLSMANFERSGPTFLDPSDSIANRGPDDAKDAVSESSSPSSSSQSSKSGSARQGLFSIDETTGIVFVVEKITDQSANYLLVIGAHDLGRPQQRKTTTTVTVRAHNSQLLQALNTYRHGNRPGSATDIRHPRGPNLLSDGSDTSGGTSGHMAHMARTNADDLRAQVGRESGGETDFDPSDPGVNTGGVRSRFASITDRTVVVILATIFALLLMTTIVLILLIKRRRDAENQRANLHKSSYDCASSNNTVRLDQPFIRAKSAPISRLDPPGQESGSCTMNSTGAKSNELSTLPRIHPIILHDTLSGGPDEMEHLEYGSPIYGKRNIYPGEPFTLISSNDDYQQAMPPCLFDRAKMDQGPQSAAGQQLSNSTELLAHSGLMLGENVTLGRKTNRPMSHQVRALCSPAEIDIYQKQGFLLNGRKTRNTKRYETIDPLMGTFRTLQGQGKPSAQTMTNAGNNMHAINNSNNYMAVTSSTITSPATLKHKDTFDGPKRCTNLNRTSTQNSNYPLDVSSGFDVCAKAERRLEALDNLAMQLHRIKHAEDGGPARSVATVDCSGVPRTMIASGTVSQPSQSSSAESPNCDPAFRLNEGQCSNNRTIDVCGGGGGTGVGGESKLVNPLINGSFKSTPQTTSSTTTATTKGVSFV